MLFTFPSRYWFTIGYQEVFSLGRWSSRIPTELHVFRRTQDTPPVSIVSSTGLLPPTVGLPRPFDFLSLPLSVSYNPTKSGLGSSRFARRYLGNRCFFLFLRVLRCFSSPGIPSFRITTKCRWVSPFGNLWINAYLQLPRAYRR